MTKEMELIYALIGKVIEYNERTAAHIFIDVSPHVSMVEFSFIDTEPK